MRCFPVWKVLLSIKVWNDAKLDEELLWLNICEKSSQCFAKLKKLRMKMKNESRNHEESESQFKMIQMIKNYFCRFFSQLGNHSIPPLFTNLTALEIIFFYWDVAIRINEGKTSAKIASEERKNPIMIMPEPIVLWFSRGEKRVRLNRKDC